MFLILQNLGKIYVVLPDNFSSWFYYTKATDQLQEKCLNDGKSIATG